MSTLYALQREWPALGWARIRTTGYAVTLRDRNGVTSDARWAGVLGVGRGAGRVVLLVVVARLTDGGCYAAVLHHGRIAGCRGRTPREAVRQLRRELRLCLRELARQIEATGSPSAAGAVAELQALEAVAP